MFSYTLLIIGSLLAIGFVVRLLKEAVFIHEMFLTQKKYEVEVDNTKQLDEITKIYRNLQENPKFEIDLKNYIQLTTNLHNDLLKHQKSMFEIHIDLGKSRKTDEQKILERLSLMHKIDLKLMFERRIKITQKP